MKLKFFFLMTDLQNRNAVRTRLDLKTVDCFCAETFKHKKESKLEMCQSYTNFYLKSSRASFFCNHVLVWSQFLCQAI